MTCLGPAIPNTASCWTTSGRRTLPPGEGRDRDARRNHGEGDRCKALGVQGLEGSAVRHHIQGYQGSPGTATVLHSLDRTVFARIERSQKGIRGRVGPGYATSARRLSSCRVTRCHDGDRKALSVVGLAGPWLERKQGGAYADTRVLRGQTSGTSRTCGLVTVSEKEASAIGVTAATMGNADYDDANQRAAAPSSR